MQTANMGVLRGSLIPSENPATSVLQETRPLVVNSMLSLNFHKEVYLLQTNNRYRSLVPYIKQHFTSDTQNGFYFSELILISIDSIIKNNTEMRSRVSTVLNWKFRNLGCVLIFSIILLGDFGHMILPSRAQFTHP